MRHYFVDTNVIIDMLANRGRFADAASELFDSAGRGEICVSICALSYSTIYYILKKYSGREFALQCLQDLSEYVCILPVDKGVIQEALFSGFDDYEDAIQYYSARQDLSVDAIVTRNVKDFRLSELPVLLPGEYLA